MRYREVGKQRKLAFGEFKPFGSPDFGAAEAGRSLNTTGEKIFPRTKEKEGIAVAAAAVKIKRSS